MGFLHNQLLVTHIWQATLIDSKQGMGELEHFNVMPDSKPRMAQISCEHQIMTFQDSMAHIN